MSIVFVFDDLKDGHIKCFVPNLKVLEACSIATQGQEKTTQFTITLFWESNEGRNYIPVANMNNETIRQKNQINENYTTL